MRKILPLFMVVMAGCGDVNHLGKSYVGAPYAVSPLGECALPDDGPLIRFDAFDCTTFVETVLAGDDVECLNRIRYKNGEVGFLTRNHFIETDWLGNNADWVQNVSARYAKTQWRRVYIDKATWFNVVHEIDVDVPSQWVDMEYIPYEYVYDVDIDVPMVVLFIADNPKIRDKIGTDIAVVHMGFVFPNRILRHASSERGMVVDVDFDEYVRQRMKNPNNIGVSLVEIK